MPIGDFPVSLSQAILAGIILVGRLGVPAVLVCRRCGRRASSHAVPASASWVPVSRFLLASALFEPWTLDVGADGVLRVHVATSTLFVLMCVFVMAAVLAYAQMARSQGHVGVVDSFVVAD